MSNGGLPTLAIMDGHGQNCESLLQKARSASTLLKAMANERRLLILCYLGVGERSVGELERHVGLSQSALSQHLAKLRNDGLVSTRRSGQTIYYSLRGFEARRILDTLYTLYCESADPANSTEATHTADGKPLSNVLAS